MTHSLQEQGLRLLAERVGVRMVDDPYRGRHLERVEWPPLMAGERQAIRDAASALRVWLAPGQRAAHIGMLARLANHRSKERSPQEWQMLLEDYAEDLAEFSDAHVAEALKEHRRSSTFFPSVAELRQRCLELRERDKWRLERAGRLLKGEK